ncbi:MAG: preprotein translocase subunit SecG [Flavobacteriales bacterium]
MFIVILAVIVAVLMALVVLIQNPKGGGLATGFQGVAQIGGVQRTTDFLEKATWYLCIALFVVALAATRMFSTAGEITDTDEAAGAPTEQTDDTGTGEGTEQPGQ